MDSGDARTRQLEETIRILSAENDALAERAEDTLLLGLIAEKVGASTEPSEALDIGLEQLALLKDIPLCACLLCGHGAATVWRSYLGFSNRSLDGITAPVTPAFQEALSAGSAEIVPGDWPRYGLDRLGQAISFAPLTGLAIAFALRGGASGFFLFADDRPDSRIVRSTVMLNRAVEALTSHLDTLHFVEALREANRDLDLRVARRTEALDAANRELRLQVADRERAEEALLVSLEKYRVLFESFPLGVTIADAQGRIVEANRTSVGLLGLSVDEQTRRTITAPTWRIVDARGVPMKSEDFASSTALRERRPVHGQLMGVERPDGSVVWLDVSAAPIPLEGYGVAITYQDVTSRLADDEALRSARERHRVLFDHAAEGIALHTVVRDSDGRVVNYRITDINHAYEANVGLRADQVVGRLATEAYGTLEPPYLAEFSSAPLTGRPLRFDTYFAPLDKHFSISVAPIGADGFATIFFDVTALRKSQLEHEKLSALVESSQEFVGLATVDGRVIYLNEAGHRLAGLAKDQPLEGLTIFDVCPPEWRVRIVEDVLPTVRERGFWAGEAAILNAGTGAVVEVEASVFQILARDTGEPLCLAMVMRDTSERARAREQRERLEAQLRQAQKMESIGRLAGGVAHDFNNLLTSILGNAELALDALDPAHPVWPYLVDVRKAGESAASLTRQLLAFSRKQIIEPRVLNLNVLLANMQRMLTRIIGEDIALSAIPAPQLPSVRADAGQMEQVIVNLVVNARDAMRGGGHLRIETAAVEIGAEECLQHPGARPGPYVVLSVSDTGIGMDEDTIAHAFEPFFTTKASGTGLGLATVYGAVVQNGGFVAIDSAVGHGTTLRIHLPAAEDQLVAASGRAAEVGGAPSGSGTILLAEDEPLVRELAVRALASAGYDVIACGSGPEALAAAARHLGEIDLLVTDVVMPGMNGRELAAQLTAVRRGMRVLFTSGHTDDIIASHGLLESGLEFLPKPYTPRALAERVGAMLGQGPRG